MQWSDRDPEWMIKESQSQRSVRESSGEVELAACVGANRIGRAGTARFFSKRMPTFHRFISSFAVQQSQRQSLLSTARRSSPKLG